MTICKTFLICLVWAESFEEIDLYFYRKIENSYVLYILKWEYFISFYFSAQTKVEENCAHKILDTSRFCIPEIVYSQNHFW